MTVNTTQVTGRRTLRFESLDDVLREAERLAGGDVQTLGNWSLGQILGHLAVALDQAIDGVDYRPNWLMRTMVRLVKKRLLTKGLSAGFQIPAPLSAGLVPPPDTTAEEGLATLKRAIDRFRSDPTRKPHVAFGELTPAEWDQLHLRHAELHLSFVVEG